jgi:hypothetical protein
MQNGLKQGDALSPLIFNFALDYAIRKVRKMKWGGGNLLGDNILVDTIKENTETVIDSNKEVDLEFIRIEN